MVSNSLTAEAVLVLMMIGIAGVWLILDQLARVLKRGRDSIALRVEIEQLAAELAAAAESESADDEPLRAAA